MYRLNNILRNKENAKDCGGWLHIAFEIQSYDVGQVALHIIDTSTIGQCGRKNCGCKFEFTGTGNTIQEAIDECYTKIEKVCVDDLCKPIADRLNFAYNVKKYSMGV